MGRFEDECEGPFELLEHSLDERGESDALVGLRVVNVFGEDRDRLCVGLGLEHVAPLLEYDPELGRVGDDTIVHDSEFGGGIRSDRMAIPFRWGSMRGPSRMRNADLGYIGLRDIDGGRGDLFAQPNDFADFLEEEDLAGLVAIYGKTSRVVSSVFLACETIAKDLKDFFAALMMKRAINTRRNVLIS